MSGRNTKKHFIQKLKVCVSDLYKRYNHYLNQRRNNLPIDECNRSFGELATEVLPRYMSVLRERMAAPVPLADFAVRGVGPVALQRRFGLNCDPSGCYVLMDSARPVYVGISRGVIKRLRDHVLGSDHMVATLAYRIAATKHPHGKTAALAMEDFTFRSRFDESRQYLLGLDTAFVEIINPLDLYLFEAYCAMELDTGFDTGGWNTFRTH